MTTDDVEDAGSILIINIPQSKTNKPRSFVVNGNGELNMVEIYRKYASLRSPATPHNRLFVKYIKGKCTVQAVGVNTFGKIPSQIARYLGLTNPAEYTGHCFRRSSATLLVDTGADILTLKRHGGWKSSTVAEGYIEESVENKINISNQVLVGKSLPQTDRVEMVSRNDAAGQSNVEVYVDGESLQNIQDQQPVNITAESLSSRAGPSNINIQNCNNCQIRLEIRMN